MNCSRCAADLPDSSTFCPRCGVSTIPSGPSSSSFSYLPPGAPSWPSSAPMNHAYANSSALPMQMEGSWSSQKPQRSLSSIAMTVILILLIPIIGVGATLGILTTQGLFPPHPAVSKVSVPSPASTPTPAPSTSQGNGNQLPAPTSFKPTSDKNVNVSLEYPADWVQDATQPGSDGTLSFAIHPPQTAQAAILFYVFHFSPSTSAKFSSADAINQAQLSLLSQQTGVTGLQAVSNANAPTAIGGANWTPEQVTFVDSTNNNNLKMDFSVVSVQHNNAYYSLAVLSPDSYYNEAVQKYISHMYTTFQFLS